MNQKTVKNTASHLHGRIEDSLKKARANKSVPQSDADVRKQFHELQVSHIELEMQNTALSELEQARAEIEVGLARYTDLYDFAPVGYFTLETDGRLNQINLTGANLLGKSRLDLSGQRLGMFVTPEYQPAFYAFLSRVFSNEGKESCEVECLNANGRRFFAHIEANANESKKTCRVVLEDITLRRSAEEALKQAQEKLEIRVLERTVDLAYANEKLRQEIEVRKKIAEELRQSREKLRQLARHQNEVKESERKRIAREIHDDLGQNLLALKIDVSMLHTRTGKRHPKLHERAAVTLGGIDAMMKSVKAIINNLHPSVLNLGLQAALEWQIKEFQRRTGIACELSIARSDMDFYLDDAIATGLFRVVQESLTNVSRHAMASRVLISLHRDDNELYLTVADDGVGIHPDCRRKANSFGLIGIQERISAMNGALTIEDGEDGIGTVLGIVIPLEQK